MNEISPLTSTSESFPNDVESRWYKRIFLSWVRPLLAYGFKNKVTEKHFFALSKEEDPSYCSDELTATLPKYSHKPFPIFSSLFATNMSIFFSALVLGGLYCISTLWLIDLLKSFLAFIEVSNPSISKGALYILGFCLLGTISWVCIQHCFLKLTKLSIRIQGALVPAIYHRFFKLNSSDRATFSSGEISNLLLQDTARISEASQALVMLIVSVFIILAASILLYLQIGISGIVGTVSAFIVIPLSNKLNKRISDNSKSLMQISDIRISRISELLSRIKTVKAMSWEKRIKTLVNQPRQIEIKLLKSLFWNTALLNLVIQSSPLFIATITFATYVFLGKTLDLPEVLSAIAIFGLLKTPVMHIPRLLIQITDAKVSIERVDKIFRYLTNDKNNDDISLQPGSIQFHNAHLGRTGNEPILKNINVDIAPSSLVSLIGTAGSGKTSFLESIIDPAIAVQGSCKKAGVISYAPQKPFIITGTIRENVLFGLEYDEDRYWQVIQNCYLSKDLNEFPERDLTELTENGGNLSGGQKQRIALARAIYRVAEIYILDDVFSALDEGVGAKIFTEVVLKFLAGKTRMITTHRLEYIKQCDRIFKLEAGFLKEVTDEVVEKSSARIEKPSERSQNEHDSNGSRVCEQSLSQSQKKITDEDRKTGRVSWRCYYDYFKKAGGFIVLFFILFVFGLRELLTVGSDLWLSYSTATIPGFEGPTIVLIFSILCGLGALATLFRTALFLKISTRIAEKVHDEMLHSILNAPVHFFETNPLGRIVNHFSKDMRAVDQEIGPRFLDAISVVFVLLSAFLVIETANPFAFGVIGLIGYLYYKIQSYYRATAPEISRLEAISHSPLFSHVQESIEGIVSIKALSMTGEFYSKMIEKLRTSLKASFTRQVIGEWLSIHLDIMGVLLLGLVAFIATVTRSHISWSLAGLSVTYVMMVTINFQRAVHNMTDLESSMISMERVQTFSSLPSENQSVKIEPDKSWPEHGRIKFENVTLAYHDNRTPVLKNVSFEVLPREKIGIIGRTGSGKSSLINALFRLVDLQKGSISIDQIDISMIRLELHRNAISLIPQDPLLVSGTLRMNLDPYSEFTEEALINSIKSVGLLPFYETIPGGLDYLVQTGGSNLSQGHRQLFSLARVLLGNSKILILDEATANVDVETDHLVQNAIRKNFGQATVITIAHRLETVIHSDRILILEDGRVVDFAPPEKLSTKEGSRLYGFNKISRVV